MKEILLEYTRPYTLDVSSHASMFRSKMEQRRSVRHFSSDPIPEEVIRDILMTASSAPSGANKQPWTFCAVSSQDIKRQIRVAAEEEEYTNYHGRMSADWLQDLEPLGTDWQKPFIELAPWLIIVFKQSYGLNSDGKKIKHYYVNESVGIASGMLIAAIHHAGLVCLTHTPSPMDFLTKILGRPENEKAWLLIPVGYPVDNVKVPEISKKTESDVINWY
jgi:iodotyrosine deiodinase